MERDDKLTQLGKRAQLKNKCALSAKGHTYRQNLVIAERTGEIAAVWRHMFPKNECSDRDELKAAERNLCRRYCCSDY
jgi:hypothetical protein